MCLILAAFILSGNQIFLLSQITDLRNHGHTAGYGPLQLYRVHRWFDPHGEGKDHPHEPNRRRSEEDFEGEVCDGSI